MLSILTRTCTHLLFILILLQPVSFFFFLFCSLYLWQICATTLSLISIDRGYFLYFLHQTGPPDLLLSKQISEHQCSLCLPPPPPQSPSPRCWVLGLESHKHSIWVFLPIIHSNTASCDSKSCSWWSRSGYGSYQIPERPAKPPS